MSNLAEIVLDYYWFLNFSSEEDLNADTACKLLEDVCHQIENKFSEQEKAQLREAASNRLKWWLREPDEHGYTPRKLLEPEQQAFLEAIAAGHFSGPFDEN